MYCFKNRGFWIVVRTPSYTVLLLYFFPTPLTPFIAVCPPATDKHYTKIQTKVNEKNE